MVYRSSPARMTVDIGVLANLADMGRSTKVQLLSFDSWQAAAARALGVSARNETFMAIGARALIDGLPFSYLLTHVPERMASP